VAGQHLTATPWLGTCGQMGRMQAKSVNVQGPALNPFRLDKSVKCTWIMRA
jgi:hypothetical protein